MSFAAGTGFYGDDRSVSTVTERTAPDSPKVTSEYEGHDVCDWTQWVEDNATALAIAALVIGLCMAGGGGAMLGLAAKNAGLVAGGSVLLGIGLAVTFVSVGILSNDD